MNRFLFIFFFLLTCFNCHSQEADFVKNKVDWASFMSRHNLVWDSLSTSWNDGAFTGNGLLGTMIYKENSKALRIDIGRSDVADHRNEFNVEFGKARLPVGHLTLSTTGIWKNANMQLNLWDAEATGNISTSNGDLKWLSYTHATKNVIVVEVLSQSGKPDFKWNWVGEESISPRSKFKALPTGYVANPPFQLGKTDGINTCKQVLLAGGEYTTAWAEKRLANKTIIYISVGQSFSKSVSTQDAVNEVKTAMQTDLNKLIQTHRNWWHKYYPESFVSIPDTRLESYYWIQQYKLASAMRGNQPATDVLGPWLAPTPWPAFWWNLNVQLTYYPVYSSNRIHLGESLIKILNTNRNNLINNVPEKHRYNSAGIGRVSSYDCISPLDVENGISDSQKELGNLTWALHNYWQHCVYTKDDSLLRHGLFPLLQRSINYYIHLLKPGSDGRLHLPKTTSPEYGFAPDCNYDLSLLRWGCHALLNINMQFNLRDKLQTKWQNVLDSLTPYPVDTNGFMIGAGVPFDKSHRHYSHLFMIYPLRLLNAEDPKSRELIERSLKHWMSLPEALAGYSFTGASSISSLLGKGDDAAQYLHKMLNQHSLSNTMYREAGPVIETPLSVVTSINEMLLQNRGDTIRVFPAIPSTWANVAFDKLRTEGAFLVTAVRENNRTKFIQIRSLKGGMCNIRHDILTEKLVVKSKSALKSNEKGLLSFEMKKGEELLLWNTDFQKLEIKPVKPEGTIRQFGLKKTR